MGVLEEDGTDAASIKPVSSLRSHFENISAVDSSLQATANSVKIGPGVDLNSRHGDLKTIARASLDIPRRPSEWSAPDTIFDTPRTTNPGTPVSRPYRLDSAILHRPASMTSLSEPRSPPRVTVDSPASPLKPLSGSGSRQLPQISPKPFVSPNLGPSALAKSPLPPQRPLSRSSVTERKEILPAENVLTKPGSKNSHQAFNSNQSEAAAKSMPPPVNRADKPKIPNKPPEILSRSNLEPIRASVDERVSPFSTPPSSDEEASSRFAFPIHNKRELVRQAGIQVQMKRQAPSVSTPNPLHEQVEDVRVSSQPRRIADARASGFAQQQVPHSCPEHDPPGLPPRRVPGRGNGIDETNSHLAPTNRSSQIQVQQRTGITHQRGTSLDSNAHINFQIPPKRAPVTRSSKVVMPESDHYLTTASKSPDTVHAEKPAPDIDGSSNRGSEYPDTSNTNRLPPYCSSAVPKIDMIYDARLLDICGQYVCTAGHVTRAWDVVSGDSVLNIGHGEKDIKVTALAFKPGTKASEEGTRLWLGTNHGELQEVDITTESIVYATSGVHGRREIAKIYRQQNSMWTLDDGGKLCIWVGDDSGLPDLQRSPSSHRVPRGHTFSLIIQDTLWFVTGKDIHVFRPLATEGSAFALLQYPLGQPSIGSISSGGVIAGQTDRVYFGHADGKVSIYSTKDFSCIGVVILSVYKINCLAGAGFYLWAGYNTGIIYVYDTRTHPWTTKKEWLAHHSSPVLNIVVDPSSLWKTNVLRVTSIGSDNTIRFWDGTLENDWLDDDMQSHDVEYCSFREITAMVVSWNAGAATPTHLRYEDKDPGFFQDLFQTTAPPDLLVFGFQELVDLEDKKLTAKTLFMGNKRKDPAEQDHMSRQYRAWRDYLVRCLEDNMPSNEPYHLLHTANMVGLFSCVFIKASQRTHIRDVSAAEIKRGMGGLHGNKGALILRFVLDDSSVCLVNCHLAAGQTQTVNRNNDMTAILESAILPAERNPLIRGDVYVGGGDGSMVLDHEICILNGDLNYRIDTMGRDTVVKAVNANNFSKLLERDQLLVSRRRNPGLRVRAFREAPITFAPTYKYDVGSDRYDTSEKRRAPAWCDRILFRGAGKIRQMDYRRHELQISDHRPVSGLFKIRVKKVFADKRERSLRESIVRFEKVKEKLAGDAKVQYLRDVLGVPPEEARRLI